MRRALVLGLLASACVDTEPLEFHREFGVRPGADQGAGDPDGRLRRDAAGGMLAADQGPAGGTHALTADATAPDAALFGCAAGQGRPEVCNEVDDDCDGLVDEGVTNACGACGDAPAEICNGRDDDCDGLTDEGVSNACGGCGPPPEESCNGEDDDCDRVIDEGFPASCADCPQASDEVCNGLDDDCDQRVDEGVLNPCGQCGAAPAEVCNGQDDDCDGQTDEGLLNACGRCGEAPAVVCNGLDDDCDGETDEGACQLFHLASDAPRWAAYDLRGAGSPWAEGLRVDAAVGLSGRDALVVLAGPRVFVLHVGTRQWVVQADRTDLFPELGEEPVVAAWDVPRWWPLQDPPGPADTFEIQTLTEVFTYRLAPDSEVPSFERREPHDTMAGLPVDRVRSTTIDLLNRRGSWPGSPREACPDTPDAAEMAGPVLVILSGNAFTVMDVGWCFEVMATLPWADWPPAALAGAPDVAALATMVYYATPDDQGPTGYYVFVDAP